MRGKIAIAVMIVAIIFASSAFIQTDAGLVDEQPVVSGLLTTPANSCGYFEVSLPNSETYSSVTNVSINFTITSDSSNIRLINEDQEINPSTHEGVPSTSTSVYETATQVEGANEFKVVTTGSSRGVAFNGTSLTIGQSIARVAFYITPEGVGSEMSFTLTLGFKSANVGYIYTSVPVTLSEGSLNKVVHFDSNGGTTAIQTLALDTNNKLVSLPTDPETEQAKLFDCWWDNVTDSEVDLTGALVPDRTYYAVWDNYVTFDSNGGSPTEAQKIAIDEDGILKSQPTTPTFTPTTVNFYGWFLNDTKIDNISTYEFEASANILAKWYVNVTWVDGDDQQIGEVQQVIYDTTPVYSGETPTKQDDTSFRYVWNTADPWDPALGNIIAPQTYKAKFTAIAVYKVTWKSQDGSTILETDARVDVNTQPTYDGAEPTKANTDQYTYAFVGWSTSPNSTEGTPAADLPVVTKETVYYAAFSETINKYTVTWKSQDGNTIYETDTKVPYGDHVSYEGAEPSKDNTAKYTYAFVGWSTDSGATSGTPVASLPTVSGDVTYYAAFSETINVYTITWKSQNGLETLLVQSDREYDSTITYTGTVPTKEGSAEYTYTFAGWNAAPNQESGSTDLGKVIGDATYYAAFSKEKNKYTITWKSQDGNTTYETDSNVEYGSSVSFDQADPGKQATAEYTYTFVGWATDVDQESGTPEAQLPTVTGNITYFAAFEKVKNKYTITWKSQDGSQLLETDSDVEYGTAISFDKEDPTKDSDAQYNYTFAGWATLPDKESGTPESQLGTVVSDATYYAAFSKTVRTYTVTFEVNDASYGSVSTTSITEVPYGSVITESGNKVVLKGTTVTATPAGDTDIHRHLFDKWTKSGITVTGEMTITADFKQVLLYTITWSVNGAETTAKWGETQIPVYSGTPTKPADDQYSYRFTGWNPAIDKVTGNQTYTAVFEAIPLATVTFDPNGGTVTPASKKVPQGTVMGTMPTPTRDEFDFAGWFTSPSAGDRVESTTVVTGSMTIYAHWQTHDEPSGDTDPTSPSETIIEYPDGSTLEITTYSVKNDDGTWTVVTEEVFTDPYGNVDAKTSKSTSTPSAEGTSTRTESREVDHDGTVIVTETDGKVSRDGSESYSKETTTDPSGSVTVKETAQVTERESDGSVSTTDSEKTTNPNGSSTESITYTRDGADGSSVMSQTDISTQRDGSSTTTIDKQTKMSYDTVVDEQTTMSSNADGSLRSVESTITLTPRSGESSTISISGDGSRIDATLQDANDEQVSIALEALSVMDSDRVVLGVENEGGSMTMSSDSIALIADSGYGISVGSDKQSVALDADTVKGLADLEGEVQLIVVVAEPEQLTPQQESVIGESYAVQVTLLVNGQEVHELDGKAEIQIEPGYQAAYVYYVGDDGVTEEISSTYDTKTGIIQFDVPHFSVYMVTADAYEPAKGGDNTVWIIAIIAIILLVLIAAIILYRRKGASV